MYHMPSSSHAEGGFELSVFLPGLRVTQLLTFGCGTAAVYSGILLVERAEYAAFFFFFKLNYLNVCFYCMFFWTLKWSKHLVSPLLSVIWLHGLSWSAGVEYASISIFLELSW